MERELVMQLARELGDAELAGQLVAARARVVRPVPDEVARRHLRSLTLAAGTATASVASVAGASSAAASTVTSAAGTVGAASIGTIGGGTILGALGGFKLGVAALATVIATAGGLGASGHLPEPAQRVVDELTGRDHGHEHDTVAPGDRHTAEIPGISERQRAARAEQVARDDEARRARDGSPPGARQPADRGGGRPEHVAGPDADDGAATPEGGGQNGGTDRTPGGSGGSGDGSSGGSGGTAGDTGGEAGTPGDTPTTSPAPPADDGGAPEPKADAPGRPDAPPRPERPSSHPSEPDVPGRPDAAPAGRGDDAPREQTDAAPTAAARADDEGGSPRGSDPPSDPGPPEEAGRGRAGPPGDRTPDGGRAGDTGRSASGR